MISDYAHLIQSNIWSIFLIVIFFGGSIFVHELGHFLAARARGVHVEQFSIGFGPAIFSWRGKDGVEYRLGCLPLGGYVLLPQLADLSALEGKPKTDAEALPPVGYLSKVIVFVAGAVFNVIFAFLLACVVWVVGQPENLETATTKIGYVSPSLELPDGSKVVSPAAEAGLQVGDVVRAIDGSPVTNWGSLMQILVTGSGRDTDGKPKAVFTVERAGALKDIVVHPRLSGEDKNRRVGISPGYDLIAYKVAPGSAGDKAGVLPGDQIVSLGGKPEINAPVFFEDVVAEPTKPLPLVVLRGGKTVSLLLPPRQGLHEGGGIDFTTGTRLTYPSPFDQVAEKFSITFKTLWGLVNPHSDIGLSKMSGPVGIVHIFRDAAELGIRAVLAITILININLAMINLLPVPVLDGGHILFATVGRVRGKALPVQFILTAQSVFLVLIFSMIMRIGQLVMVALGIGNIVVSRVTRRMRKGADRIRTGA